MKAGYGKTVRPVCAADGGKLFNGRLLRPDSCEANEQSRATGCGVGGAKGGGRGECESAKHGPGTGPGNRVTGAEAQTEFRENITTRRHTPEVGEAMGRAAEVVASSSSIRTDGDCPVAQVNDLSRSLTAFDPISTLVVVVEMSKASWLVSGVVPGVERQPLKKLEPDETARYD